MPAAGVRVTFFYSNGIFGISETHVWCADVEIPIVVVPAVTLMKKRLALSGFGLKAFALRMSKIGSFREAQVLKADALAVDNPGLTTVKSSYNLPNGDPAQWDNASDQSKSALLIAVQGSVKGHKKQFFLAGVPDVVIETYPDGSPVALQPWWAKKWDTYRTELTGKSWGFVGNVLPSAGNPAKPILSVVTQQATGLAGIVLAAGALTLAVGDLVQVRNTKRTNVAFASLNGKWQVAQVSVDSPSTGQNTYFLLNSTLINPATITKTGNVLKVDSVSVPYLTAEISGPTSRKRGNRFLTGPARRVTRKPLPA